MSDEADKPVPTLLPTPTPYELADRIIKVVLQFSGLTRKVLNDPNRRAYTSKARDTIVYLIRTHTDLSHEEAAKLLGRNHPMSVIACQREKLRLERKLPKKLGSEQVSYAEWHKRVMSVVNAGGLQ